MPAAVTKWPGACLTVLRVFNRLIAGLALVATLIGGALCLAAGIGHAGPGADPSGWDDIVTATELGLVVFLIALGASWLFERRHPALWAGEATLLLAVIASLIYGLVLR